MPCTNCYGNIASKDTAPAVSAFPCACEVGVWAPWLPTVNEGSTELITLTDFMGRFTLLENPDNNASEARDVLDPYVFSKGRISISLEGNENRITVWQYCELNTHVICLSQGRLGIHHHSQGQFILTKHLEGDSDVNYIVAIDTVGDDIYRHLELSFKKREDFVF